MLMNVIVKLLSLETYLLRTSIDDNTFYILKKKKKNKNFLLRAREGSFLSCNYLCIETEFPLSITCIF